MNTKLKKLVLPIITAIILLLAYGCFFKFHLASDAYRIIDNSNAFMINLKFNEGRLFQVLYFIILDFCSLSIDSIDMYMFLYRINSILSIIILTICVLLVYKLIKDNLKTVNIQKSIIVFICSLLMFINISVSEYLLYFENVVMILGLFLAVFAAYIYHTNTKLKYTIIPILILMSSFCYQGVAQIFVILSALILLIKRTNNEQKNCLKDLFKILILYLFPLVINYFITWWLNCILPNIDPRLFTGILQSLKNLLCFQNIITLTIYMILFGVLILFNPKLFMGKNLKMNLLNIFYLMTLSIISFVVFVFNNSVRLIPRTLLNFIIIYPVLKIYITNLKENHKFDIVWVAILLITNIGLVSHLQISNIKSTTQNINVVQSIIEAITEYETENNIKIENLAFYDDSLINDSYWKCKDLLHYTYTCPIYYGYWCDIYSMNVLSYRIFNRIDDSNVDKYIYDYFLSQDWDEPNIEEQIIFKGNTAHICRF